MPDLADDANNTVEIELAASLSVQRKNAERIAKQRKEHEEKNLAAGICLNCRETIATGTLYCPPLDPKYDKDGKLTNKSECQTDHEGRLGKRRQQAWA